MSLSSWNETDMKCADLTLLLQGCLSAAGYMPDVVLSNPQNVYVACLLRELCCILSAENVTASQCALWVLEPECSGTWVWVMGKMSQCCWKVE